MSMWRYLMRVLGQSRPKAYQEVPQHETQQRSISTPLALPLAEIAATGEKVEAAATGLLTAIRKAGLQTLGAFDDALNAAYEANKWNTRPGKPAKDRRAVPHTVRTYAWEIRSAYRAGLEVWTFKTMYELRMKKKALAEAPSVETTGDEVEIDPAQAIPEEVTQDLLGVKVVNTKQPNGALFHDLICTFITLPQAQRALFGRQLSRLLHRYQPEVAKPAAGKAKAA
jgi:hypothetical protein